MSNEQTETLREAVHDAGRNAVARQGGVFLHASDWLRILDALATPSPAPSDTLVEAETYRAMHEIARGLGYPSILEALEATPPRRWTDCGNVGWCHAEGRCTRHTLRRTGGSHD